MAGSAGAESNPESPLIAEWNRNNKDIPEALDSLPEGLELDRLFDTLAEWNEYLENHVPYFSERAADEGCEP